VHDTVNLRANGWVGDRALWVLSCYCTRRTKTGKPLEADGW
jgi:hypothetical protein